MKKNDVVMFHTPLSDENPNDRYLLLEEPAEELAHVEKFNKAWPNAPMQPSLDIEYLGRIVDGKLVPTTLTFRPIQTVKPTDLETDTSFVYEKRDGGFAINAV